MNLLIKSLLELLFILLSAVILYYCLIMSRYVYVWWSMPMVQPGSVKGTTKISIILPVRNEEINILPCLDSLLKQNYPSELYEIIVVDDDSEDNTLNLVNTNLAGLPEGRIRVLHLKSDSTVKAHKKRAIAAGITLSSGDLIVTTDGDCTMGPSWLKSIAELYERENPVLIIGPVAFRNEENILGLMQTLEFAGLMAVTGASAKVNAPLMCNGANLAYTRKAYEAAGGFQEELIASGDDVLMMQKIWKMNPDKIRFLKTPEAIVWTKPQENLQALLNQRKRWSSKYKAYGRGKIQETALIVYFSNLFLLIGVPICIVIPGFRPFYLILAGAKLIIDFLFLFLAVSFINRRKILWLYLFELLVYPFYVVLSGFLGIRSGSEWKGRKI
jgi:cellulose synthase/poly-beta-1,6-N-acetylglucosamine synthase-like glycosyltransferase